MMKKMYRWQGRLHSVAPYLFMLVLLIVVPSQAQAQLFGQRSLGQSLGPGSSGGRSGASATRAASSGTSVGNNAGGTIQGAERFLRENRSTNAFVGADRKDTNFVGSGQSMGNGTVRAATESLQELGSKKGAKNPPLAPVAKKGLYYPRLVLDDSFFEAPLPTNPSENSAYRPTNRTTARAANWAALQQRLQNQTQGQVTLAFEGSTAILQGVVASQALADRLYWLTSFEPGIDRVENRLEIQKSGN